MVSCHPQRIRRDRYHHANRRGYEELYEVSRRGRVFSRSTRAVMVGGYHHSPFVRITVKGAIVTLSKENAVADSFAQAGESATGDRTTRDGSSSPSEPPRQPQRPLRERGRLAGDSQLTAQIERVGHGDARAGRAGKDGVRTG